MDQHTQRQLISRKVWETSLVAMGVLSVNHDRQLGVCAHHTLQLCSLHQRQHLLNTKKGRQIQSLKSQKKNHLKLYKREALI